jgi:hypothetical protein
VDRAEDQGSHIPLLLSFLVILFYRHSLDASEGQVLEKRISTHGPRNSRREQWRMSKGMTAKPVSRGMNRQGGNAARYRAGRPKRRR